MNQISGLRWLLILIASFAIYFILSYQQAIEREKRFQEIDQSITEIKNEIKQLREEIQHQH